MKREFTAVALFGLISCAGFAQTRQEWEVAGTVTGDSGPVKDAYVMIAGPSSIPGVRTDGQGRYSLTGVVPGRYSIRVQKKDNTSEPRSRSLSLTNGMRLRIDFRIPKGAVISGRVLDENKQPVSGLIVLAMSKSTRDGRARLDEKGGDKTNDLGEYRIPYLPEGSYVIAATSKPLQIRKRASGSGTEHVKGYPPITFHPGTRFLDTAAAMEIGSGEERPGVDIVLQKESTSCVSFKVGSGFAGAGASLAPHAQLEQRIADAPALAEARVTATESYDICGLAPGEYRLHLTSLATKPFQVLAYQMAVAVVDKQSVDLGTLETLDQLDIAGAVSVKDARPEDSIPAGIRIRIVAGELRAIYTDTRPGAVQPDGRFVLSRVFTGDYGVRVDGLPAGYYVIGASQQGRSVLESGLRPGGGDLKITLATDGPVVSGRVLANDDAVIPDATVFLVPKGPGRLLAAQSDQTGAYRFAFGVQPGEYRLAAASDVAESQRQNLATAARFAANGTDLKLEPRESRAIDLRIQAAR